MLLFGENCDSTLVVLLIGSLGNSSIGLLGEPIKTTMKTVAELVSAFEKQINSEIEKFQLLKEDYSDDISGYYNRAEKENYIAALRASLDMLKKLAESNNKAA